MEIMVWNYFKIALRNIKKQKIYSFINIFGLAIGMTSFILIFLFVRNEMSYDSFHKKSYQIFRLGQNVKGKPLSGSPAPLGPALNRNFQEILDYVRISKPSYRTEKVLIRFKEKSFYETKFFMADIILKLPEIAIILWFINHQAHEDHEEILA